jgi:hypothetical protein
MHVNAPLAPSNILAIDANTLKLHSREDEKIKFHKVLFAKSRPLNQ